MAESSGTGAEPPARQGKAAAEKYTKADIVDSLREKTGIRRKLVRIVVDAFIDEIKEALTRNLSIELRGFGTFEVKFRKGRSKARNPMTGEEVAVLSHGAAVFRPGQELKQAVWGCGRAAGPQNADIPNTGARNAGPQDADTPDTGVQNADTAGALPDSDEATP